MSRHYKGNIMAKEPESNKIIVAKLEAGKRQLRTAIRLWFDDEDPVSIHTLVSAAYEIIHSLARRRGAADLLFDSYLVKDEYRKYWVNSVKRAAIFFKHADRDPEGILEFFPLSNEIFFMFSCSALSKMGDILGKEEMAILYHLMFSRPDYLREEARQKIAPKAFEDFSRISKRDFLEQFSIAWDRGDVRGKFPFPASPAK